MNFRNLLVYPFLLLLTNFALLGGQQRKDPKPSGQNPQNQERGRLARLREEFLKMKFGMFIHFNMATYHGVQWVRGYPDPSTFNPGGTIDTDAWAEAALAAGMKYAVLTAKHVAGSCLWDSKYTTYDIMNPRCPYKKDLVAQFIESFKKRGLKVGLYYCWRNPGFDRAEARAKTKYKVLPPECDPDTHSLKEQIEFQKKQIAELVEKYPDVFYIWNDGLDPQIMPQEKARSFFNNLRRKRPNLLASSNWWDWGKKGRLYLDIAIKEMRLFPKENKLPGETCWCLERSWFWFNGTRPKKAKQIVDLLRTVNSRNSNLLLNVGPNRRGKIIEPSLKTLREVGRLIAKSKRK